MSRSDTDLSRPRPGQVESRRYPRESPAGLDLREPIEGRIVNVSALGLCLEAASYLDPHSQHTFAIEVGQARGVAVGEVRWCKQKTDARDSGSGEATSVYRSGIALLEPVVLL